MSDRIGFRCLALISIVVLILAACSENITQPEPDRYDFDNSFTVLGFRDITFNEPYIERSFISRSSQDGKKQMNLQIAGTADMPDGTVKVSIKVAVPITDTDDYPQIGKYRYIGGDNIIHPGEFAWSCLLEDDGSDVRSLILPTDVENLSLLPAGRPRRNSTELLSSDAMENICETFASLSSQKIIIFDSPPILQTSEAKVLAGLAGQVVVVVRAGVTAQEAVAAALATLDGEKAVSVVLNQIRFGRCCRKGW